MVLGHFFLIFTDRQLQTQLCVDPSNRRTHKKNTIIQVFLDISNVIDIYHDVNKVTSLYHNLYYHRNILNILKDLENFIFKYPYRMKYKEKRKMCVHIFTTGVLI